jgi:hypothetical protein
MRPDPTPKSRGKKSALKRAQPNAPKSTVGPPLFKADASNLAFSTDKEGGVRMFYSGWDDPKVLGAGKPQALRTSRIAKVTLGLLRCPVSVIA